MPNPPNGVCPKVLVAGAAVCPNSPPVVPVAPNAGLFAPNPPPSVDVVDCAKPKPDAEVAAGVLPNGFPNVLPAVVPKAGVVVAPNVLVDVPNNPPAAGWA